MATNRDRKSFRSRPNIPNIALTSATLTCLIRLQAFRDPLRGELPHVQIFMNNALNQLTCDAQLLSY